MFVDEARIFVASGKGGDGAVSFHREKYRPKGGPDGGDGGRGGSVVLLAEPGISSLGHLRDHPHQKASPGGRGAKNNRTGADAQDLMLHVPLGTVVKAEDGTLMADLASPGDTFTVAKGGRGGRGNAAFASEARRVPGFGELGEPGEERWVLLELRLIADAAIIGMPNVGKSSLVSALSAARPKVADYPFTTLEPSLGVVALGEDRFTVCDIPGLIQGAHEGKGLGLKFLRHVTRAPVFVHLLDPTSGRDLIEDHQVVRNELRRFDPELAGRPEVVALSKADLLEPSRRAELVADQGMARLDPLFISSVSGEGLDELRDKLWEQITQERQTRDAHEGFELFSTPERKLTVKKENEGWRVEGGNVGRWVAMTDMTNSEAVAYLQERFERGGVEKALAEAGADKGDEVWIGDFVFEWWPAGSEPPMDPDR